MAAVSSEAVILASSLFAFAPIECVGGGVYPWLCDVLFCVLFVMCSFLPPFLFGNFLTEENS